MGICVLKQDHPFRIQFGPNLVVHAAREYTYGGFYRSTYKYNSGNRSKEYIPEQKRITLACSRGAWKYTETDENMKNYLVPNNTPITCKSCLKKLGMDEDYEPSNVRYVVKDNETEEYYRHGYGCSWVENILDATLYKVKHGAENHTRRYVYADDKGNQLAYNKFAKLREIDKEKAQRYKRTRIKSPRYDVVTITIDIKVQDE
jgi:hypothetical protein